jgi:predicted DNA-binding ArsR family transcriptional regulator
MFGKNKTPTQKSLTDILGVFYTAQEELQEFIETKTEEKAATEARLNNISNDLAKSESTLSSLSKILD